MIKEISKDAEFNKLPIKEQQRIMKELDEEVLDEKMKMKKKEEEAQKAGRSGGMAAGGQKKKKLDLDGNPVVDDEEMKSLLTDHQFKMIKSLKNHIDD